MGAHADDTFAVVGHAEQHVERDPLLCSGCYRRGRSGLAVQTHPSTGPGSVGPNLHLLTRQGSLASADDDAICALMAHSRSGAVRSARLSRSCARMRAESTMASGEAWSVPPVDDEVTRPPPVSRVNAAAAASRFACMMHSLRSALERILSSSTAVCICSSRALR